MPHKFDYLTNELAEELNKYNLNRKRAGFVDCYADLFNDLWQQFHTIDARLFFHNDFSMCDPLTDHTLISEMRDELVMKLGEAGEDKSIVINNWANFLLAEEIPANWFKDYKKLLKAIGEPAPKPLIDSIDKSSGKSAGKKPEENEKSIFRPISPSPTIRQPLGPSQLQNETSFFRPLPTLRFPDSSQVKKGQGTSASSKNAYVVDEDPEPAYLGRLNKAALKLQIINPYKDKNEWMRKKQAVSCERCWSNEHTTNICPDGGYVCKKSDGQVDIYGEFPKCFCCGNRHPKYMQHIADTCPRLHPNWRPHTCFNCAEKGHKVDDCPMKRRGPRPGYKGFVFPPREVREKRGGRVVAFEDQFPEMMEAFEAWERKHEPHYILTVELASHTTDEDIMYHFNGYTFTHNIEGVGHERRAILRFWNYREAKQALNHSNGKLLNGHRMHSKLHQE